MVKRGDRFSVDKTGNFEFIRTCYFQRTRIIERKGLRDIPTKARISCGLTAWGLESIQH